MKSDGKNPAPMQRKNELESFDRSVFDAIRGLLIEARTSVYKAVNFAMVQAYWEIGKQIDEAVGNRAEYGKGLLQFWSEKLKAEFSNGVSVRNLRFFRQFYQTFQIRNTLCTELSWSHYRRLIRVDNAERRAFYLKECVDKNETIAKYSVLADNENLFASKYMLYLPTEEELKREIERERDLLELEGGGE